MSSFTGHLSVARTSYTVLLKRLLALLWEKYNVLALRLLEVQAPAQGFSVVGPWSRHSGVCREARTSALAYGP